MRRAHRVGYRYVKGRPGFSNVRRETRSKPLLKRPEERLLDGFVIPFLDLVTGAAAQCGEGGQDRLHSAKPFDRPAERNGAGRLPMGSAPRRRASRPEKILCGIELSV